LPDYDKKNANFRVRENNTAVTKTVVKGHISTPFSSNVVGEVRPVSAAIPSNRAEFAYMIEKPTLALSQLNDKHVPLGRWIIRSAVGKEDGEYVCNMDEVYLEQDFYYLSANGKQNSNCTVRQLPADFSRKKKVEEGEYNVDRRGVFRIRLADTNPNMNGLSVSDKSVEMLEARAKRSLQSSEAMRNGQKEYAVIDMDTGMPKALHGGTQFSKEIRLQLKSQVETMDDASLKSVQRRQGDMHKFFEDEFDRVGPPDDDIIAKLSGANSVIKVPSLDGEGSVVSKLSYGPVVGNGSRPNSVSFKKKASKYRHASVVEGLDFLPSIFDNTTIGTTEEDGFDEHTDLVDRSFDKLCASRSVGGTFQKLREEDQEVFAKLADEWDREEAEKRRLSNATTPSPQRSKSGSFGFGANRYDSPETVMSDDSSLGDESLASAASGRSFRSTGSRRDLMKRDKSSRELRKQELVSKSMEKQASVRKIRKTRELKALREGGYGKKKTRDTLMLPTERAKILREKAGSEVKPFSKLIPGLLESYTKPNMMKYMASLDSLISSRLSASERQRKFQELANFEQMARENLEIEKAVRERKEQEVKEREAKERAAKLAENAAKRVGGGGRKSVKAGSRGSSRASKRWSRTSRTSNSSPSHLEGVDAIESELDRSGLRQIRRTTSKENYLKRLTQPVKIGGK